MIITNNKISPFHLIKLILQEIQDVIELILSLYKVKKEKVCDFNMSLNYRLM